jgi:hypothetical protein
MGMVVPLLRVRPGRHRYGENGLGNFRRRHVHVFGLRMIEEGVLQRHQQHELDGDNENDVAGEGRAARPLENACAQKRRGALTGRK